MNYITYIFERVKKLSPCFLTKAMDYKSPFQDLHVHSHVHSNPLELYTLDGIQEIDIRRLQNDRR